MMDTEHDEIRRPASLPQPSLTVGSVPLRLHARYTRLHRLPECLEQVSTQPRLPHLTTLVPRKDPRSRIVIQRLEPQERQHLSRAATLPLLDHRAQQPQRAQQLRARGAVGAPNLDVVHQPALGLLPAEVQEAAHGGEVREVEARRHGWAGVGEERGRHDLGLEVDVVEVLAGAVALEGEHVVGAGRVRGVFEGDAEVVRQRVGLVVEDILGELVICGLPL